ncbi:MAG TPA: YkgJ family cysteine cluster protein [Alphaproteobacteria bacterium]|nr:YkgJ family cysteine cluster protein [Alphaproteobacteria bacterium]
METIDIEAEALADKARNSLSSYCYNECKAKCCRMGFLLLSEKEIDVFPVDKAELKTIPVQEDGKKFILDLKGGCVNLKDNKCSIYSKRPKTCSDYPLFVRKDKTILVAETCQGVQEEKLYPYLAELKQKGYKIVYK